MDRQPTEPDAWPDLDRAGAAAALAELDLLCGHDLAAWLAPPIRLVAGEPSLAHLPLARWLVAAVRPARIHVVLGRASSFAAALCEAVLATETDALATIARAPDSGIDPGFESLVARRYGGSVRILAAPTADRPEPGAGTIDLLSVEAGTAGLDPALPALLSPRGIAIVHRIDRAGPAWRDAFRPRPDGAAEARAAELAGDGGLAIVAPGGDPPPGASALIALLGRGDARAARLRRALASLGARAAGTDDRPPAPRADAVEIELRRALGAALRARDEARRALPDPAAREAEHAELARLRERAGQLERAVAVERARGAGLLARLAEAAREADLADASAREAERRRAAADAARDEAERRLAARLRAGADGRGPLGRLRGARSRRVADTPPPARAPSGPDPADDGRAAGDAPVGDRLQAWLATLPAALADPPPPAAPGEPDPRDAPAAGTRDRMLFVAGEPDEPGARYRSAHLAALSARFGRQARAMRLEDVGPADIESVGVLVLWRAAWSAHVETMIGLVRAAGGLVLFDLDDLVIDPALARPAVIDGIAAAEADPDALAHLFARLRRTAAAADACLATTEELARALRVANTRVVVIPNGFLDADADRAALAWRRERLERGPDPLVRIGYASGSRTHRRDFAVAAPAIARVLAARPQVRLVLFRGQAGPTLDPSEHPALDGLADRIEWRAMVEPDRLPDEIARFDIAICPLETGNPFCEAKSELKYVDAALCRVPLVASPTGPYRRAIADGCGLLAADAAEWERALLALVDDAGLRAAIGDAARAQAEWRFGPRRRGELLDRALAALAPAATPAAGRAASLAAELAIRRGDYLGHGPPAIPPTETVFGHETLAAARASVVITSHDYAHVLEEALASVAAQTLDPIELVVIDDASSDHSVALLRGWAEANRERFARISVRRTLGNVGLGRARNAGFAAATSRHVMVLDADNRLLPEACATLLGRIEAEDAAFAYAGIRMFGEMEGALGGGAFDPLRLVPGNYIDAMAMVATWAWSAAGGFYDNPGARGWEDYDLWCRLVELGQRGAWDPATLAEYRVHGGSMTNAVTERDGNKERLVAFLEARHGWLRLRSRRGEPRAAPGPDRGAG